ncbi:MAG: hypothetical protein ACP5XB_28240 [Isosphaeraceae bacterium]
MEIDVGALDTEPPQEYEYEVLVFDLNRQRRLVAAVELVSPANKDRPHLRETFVAKCAALLRKGVAVSIVDLVTIRRFNLYAQLMEFIEHADPTLSPTEPSTYAASCRWVARGTSARLEAWSHAQAVGEPRRTLPLWLSEDLNIPPDLESSYERTCHDLWIARKRAATLRKPEQPFSSSRNQACSTRLFLDPRDADGLERAVRRRLAGWEDCTIGNRISRRRPRAPKALAWRTSRRDWL